jgi:hypothetical protein
MQRVNKILDIKEYLIGNHKILNRSVEIYNGKEYYPRMIILQYAKTIVNFAIAYLLQNPITLTGNEKVVSHYKQVYKKGKYNKVDFDLLDKVVKYGNGYEYLYFDENKEIKSKLINPEDGYPIYDHENKLTNLLSITLLMGLVIIRFIILTLWRSGAMRADNYIRLVSLPMLAVCRLCIRIRMN